MAVYCACPVCTQNYLVEDADVDGVVKCPHCGVEAKPTLVSEAPVEVLSTVAVIEEGQGTDSDGPGCGGSKEDTWEARAATCPVCGKEASFKKAPGESICKCSACMRWINASWLGPPGSTGARFPEAALPAEAVSHLLSSEISLRSRRREEQLIRPLPARQLRTVTAITLGIGVVCTLLTIAIAIWLVVQGKTDEDTMLMWTFLPMTLGLGGLLIGAVFKAYDNNVLSEKASLRSGDCLESFLEGLRTGREEYAFARTLVPEPDRPVLRPALSVLSVEEGRFDLGRLQPFGDYWRPIMTAKVDKSRAVGTVTAKRARKEGDLVLASTWISYGSMKSDKRNTGIAVLLVLLAPLAAILYMLGAGTRQPRERLHLYKLVRKIAGRWYLASSELFAPEDDPAAFDEVVRISKLSDSELEAEARVAGLQAGGV